MEAKIAHNPGCPGERLQTWREITSEGTWRVWRCKACGAVYDYAIEVEDSGGVTPPGSVVPVGQALEETEAGGMNG